MFTFSFLFPILGKTNGVKRKDWDCRSIGVEIERKAQHLSLQVPLRSHSSSSSSEETSSSSAALPLLAGEKDSPSSTAEDHLGQKEFLPGTKREDGHGRLVTFVLTEGLFSTSVQNLVHFIFCNWFSIGYFLWHCQNMLPSLNANLDPLLGDRCLIWVETPACVTTTLAITSHLYLLYM